MDINASIVFESNYTALQNKVRNIVNEGGSRSTKTYSICQLLIIYALQNKNKTINVFRKALTTCRATVMQDFLEVIRDMEIEGLYVFSSSKSQCVFNNGTTITFRGADDEQKLRGLKGHISWLNEANELLYDDYNQIAMRTEYSLIYDYNPSMNNSWIYELPEHKTIKIHSTYLDNPFLSKEQIDHIENYKLTDPDYYSIFALGKRAQTKENVYHEWEVVKERPKQFNENDFVYGLDFGFDHPTALVKIYYNKTEIYVEEEIYESNLTTPDLNKLMKDLNINKSKAIPADYSRPEIIQDLNNNGFNCLNAIKDVKDGIMNVKSFKVYVNHMATNIIKENQLYKWKKVNGIIMDEPVKLFDDAMDAIRYGVFYIKKYLLDPGTDYKVYHFNF